MDRISDANGTCALLNRGISSLSRARLRSCRRYAYQETGLFLLDEAGGKSHTVTVVMPSRVFPIVQTKLDQHSPVPPVAPSTPHPEPPH